MPVTGTRVVYVAGFLFSDDGGKVLLIQKSHPDWQRGKLNGVGGHVEPGETPAAAMQREFEEEAGLTIGCWESRVTLVGRGFTVHFFAVRAALSTLLGATAGTPDEPLCVVDVHDIPQNVPPNLRWLIPLCLDRSVVTAVVGER
jgi:8-oxo-dGTP diphosphatase